MPSILYATVLAYDTTKVKEAPTSINALLPEEIAVRECTAGPPGFDARRDARPLRQAGRPTLQNGISARVRPKPPVIYFPL